MTGDSKKRPRAFRLDPRETAQAEAPIQNGDFTVEPQPDAFAPENLGAAPDAAEQAVEIAQKRGLLQGGFLQGGLPSWSGLFWAAIGGLFSFAIGLWLNQLIDQLFARSAALGYIGLALAGLALVALAAIAAREVYAIFRQRHIARLHIALAQAREADDRDAARLHVGELIALYESRPETAEARANLTRLRGEIIDGRDLIDIAERELMQKLDDAARRQIASAAKSVSILTAVSPRAILDVIFVAAQALRLIRRIAEIYGGRPGWLGVWKLARAVGTHLAITGGMAVGDSLLQQFVGHGIAAKLSARLGEGVLNGLLTARVGLSAMAVCRPMPFAARKQPGVSDVAPFLMGGGEKSTKQDFSGKQDADV